MHTRMNGRLERELMLLLTCLCVACCFGSGQAAQAHDPKSEPTFKHLNKVIEKLERGLLSKSESSSLTWAQEGRGSAK